MKCASHGSECGDWIARYLRRAYRFAGLVEATFAWWDKVPPAVRTVLVVVVLQQAGLLLSVTDAMSAIGR